MSYENYLIEAVDLVCAWGLEDEVLGDAILSQACALVGMCPEE